MNNYTKKEAIEIKIEGPIKSGQDKRREKRARKRLINKLVSKHLRNK